jgi:hypothetical protein
MVKFKMQIIFQPIITKGLPRLFVFLGAACFFCLGSLCWAIDSTGWERWISGFALLIIISWFIALGKRLSSLLLCFASCCIFVEWLYRYGETGPVFFTFGILTLVWLKFWRESFYKAWDKFDTVLITAVSLAAITFVWAMIGIIRECELFSGALTVQKLEEIGAVGLLFRNIFIAFLCYRFFKQLKDSFVFDPFLPVLFCIFLPVYSLFFWIREHEYLYFFGGFPDYIVHPQFAGAEGLIFLAVSALLIFGCLKYSGRRRIISAAALIMVLAILVLLPPPIVLRPCWENVKLAQVMAVPVCFAAVLIFDLATSESSWERKYFQGLFGILLIYSFLLPGIENHIGAAILVLAALLVRQEDRLISIDSRIAIWDKRIGKMFRVSFGCLMLLITVSAAGAAWKVYKGPRIETAQEDFLVPDYFVKQLLIAEDLLYFEHFGFDFARMKKSFRDNLRTGEYKWGGSTITMQLAKILYLEYGKTLVRKVHQCWIALGLEVILSKNEILKRYLSTLDFGPGGQGIVSGSRYYFQKLPEMLTRRESLALVLSIPDPWKYNPDMNIKNAGLKKKAGAVRGRMRRFGGLLDRKLRTLDIVK